MKKLKNIKKYQLGAQIPSFPVDNQQNQQNQFMWGNPTINAGLNNTNSNINNNGFTLKTGFQFGQPNYSHIALSNTLQAIMAGFRENHANKEQNQYFQNQFNPLNIITKTGNTSQQQQFGMDYFKKGGHLIPKDTLIHGKKISAKQRKFFSDLCNMEQGGEVDEIFGLPIMQQGGPIDGSVVNYLASKGQAFDKESRKKLAAQMGVEGYDFSAAKNTELLSRLQSNKQSQYTEDNRLLSGEMMPGAYDPNTDSWDPTATPGQFARKIRSSKKKPIVQQAPQVAPAQQPQVNVPVNNIQTNINPNPFINKTQLTPDLIKAITKQDPQQIGSAAGNLNQIGNSLLNAAPEKKGVKPTPLVNNYPMPWYQPISKKPESKGSNINGAGVHPINTNMLPLSQVIGGANQEDSWMKKQLDNSEPVNALNTIPKRYRNLQDDITLAKNWFKRNDLKSSGDDPKATPKLVMPNIPDVPPIIRGDTVYDSKRVFHQPMIVDLNKVKMGSKSRGDNSSTDTEGMLFSGIDADTILNSKETPPNPNRVYVGVDSEGNVQAGPGSKFMDKEYKYSPFNSYTTTGFVKENGNFKLGKSIYHEKYKLASPILKTLDGQEMTTGLQIKRNSKNKETEIYGGLNGGKMIFTTPDYSKKIFVSGSLYNINEALEKFKKDNNVDHVIHISLDNGTHGRTYQTTDKTMTPDDWNSYFNRSEIGGAGFYLKGKGYQTGGVVNTTGYLDGSKTASNPYNIIPGDQITMDGVSQKIQATPIYNGIPGQPTVMHPGLDYSFKGADHVYEQPLQQGGVIPPKLKLQPNGNFKGLIPFEDWDDEMLNYINKMKFKKVKGENMIKLRGRFTPFNMGELRTIPNAASDSTIVLPPTTIFQEGGTTKKKPIYVTNPNDPRYIAYGDSARKNNITKALLKDYLPIRKDVINNESIIKFGENSKYDEPYKNDKIKPVGFIDNNADRSFEMKNGVRTKYTFHAPLYPEPVQPVVYQKPVENLPNGYESYKKYKGREIQKTGWKSYDEWKKYDPNAKRGYEYFADNVNGQIRNYARPVSTKTQQPEVLANPENYKAHGKVQITSPQQSMMEQPAAPVQQPTNWQFNYPIEGGQGQMAQQYFNSQAEYDAALKKAASANPLMGNQNFMGSEQRGDKYSALFRTAPRYQSGGAVDFDKEFEDEILGETKPQQTEQPEDVQETPEQNQEQPDVTPEWLSYLLGDNEQEVSNSSMPAGAVPSKAGFRSFATPEEGRAALENQLELYKTGRTKVGLSPNSTLFEAMSKWAPYGDGKNDPMRYASVIARKLGITVDTPISKIPTDKWADIITQMEGNKSGNNPGNLR